MQEAVPCTAVLWVRGWATIILHFFSSFMVVGDCGYVIRAKMGHSNVVPWSLVLCVFGLGALRGQGAARARYSVAEVRLLR